MATNKLSEEDDKLLGVTEMATETHKSSLHLLRNIDKLTISIYLKLDLQILEPIE